jgi:hypothetical protein
MPIDSLMDRAKGILPDSFWAEHALGVAKTRSAKPFWDKSARSLMTGQTATGVEGARVGCRFLCGTAGNQCSDGKGEAQATKIARREYRSGALGRTDPY